MITAEINCVINASLANLSHDLFSSRSVLRLAVKKAIVKVGHDTEGIKATENDYENLHHCCKYDREAIAK